MSPNAPNPTYRPANAPSALILLTGAPSIGKSTVARELLGRLNSAAWLDGDDVWRINPFSVNTLTKALVERNICCILRNYLEAGLSWVILSWVLHRQEIIDRLLFALADVEHECYAFALVADEAALCQRYAEDARRDPLSAPPLDRLRQSRETNTIQIDTTNKTPQEVAAEVLQHIGPQLVDSRIS